MEGAVASIFVRIPGLDALRGLAAIAVVLHHVAIGIDVPMPAITNYFGLGVPLFYLISAFTMYHVYFDRSLEPTFARKFMIRRYGRLLPAYLVMLSVMAATVGVNWMALPAYLTLTFGFVPAYSGGGVWAAWSIGVEMMFYLLFPVMVNTLRTRLSLSIAAVVLVALVFSMQSSLVGPGQTDLLISAEN